MTANQVIWGWRRDSNGIVRYAGMDGEEDPEIAEQLARKYAEAPGYSLVHRLPDGDWMDESGQPVPCTPTSPCRACRDRMAAKEAPIEPARPVEDRDEPIEQPESLHARWMARRFDDIDEVIDLRFDVLIAAVHDLTVELIGGFKAAKPTNLEKLEALADGFQIDQALRPTAAQVASREQAAFERGRQQGDADRAARGLSEFERGMAVGAAGREAELLEAGWTPPCDSYADNPAYLAGYASGTHDRNITGPTDYEVWRDALTLSATNVFPIDGTGEAGTFDNDRRAQILADAGWFRDKLINYPTISPTEADKAADDQIAKLDGDETTTMRRLIDGQDDIWYEVGPDQWLMNPKGDLDDARSLKYIEDMYGIKPV